MGRTRSLAEQPPADASVQTLRFDDLFADHHERLYRALYLIRSIERAATIESLLLSIYGIDLLPAGVDAPEQTQKSAGPTSTGSVSRAS